MKKQTRSGFIIGVIGAGILLMVWMFFGKVRVTDKPREGSQTRVTISALQQAMARFQNEYLKLPETGANDFTTEEEAGRRLVILLLGKEETGANMQNPRRIPFLNATVSRNKTKGGLVYSSDIYGGVEGLFDTWGNPFRVILDLDNDGVIQFDCGGKPQEVRGKYSVVLSRGKVGVEGTEDDLKSW